MRPKVSIFELDDERIVFVAINSIRKKDWEYTDSASRAGAFAEAQAYCAGASHMAEVIEMTPATTGEAA